MYHDWQFRTCGEKNACQGESAGTPQNVFLKRILIKPFAISTDCISCAQDMCGDASMITAGKISFILMAFIVFANKIVM